MIVGNGQLAYAFEKYDTEGCVIFASGVANSNCKHLDDFLREKKLLLKTMKEHKNKTLVYFSSCALSVDTYKTNAYYEHKKNMENVVKTNSSQYIIVRLPQVFGEIKPHNTLTNFLYYKIMDEEKFTIYRDAYRYLIDIKDIPKFIFFLMSKKYMNETIDFFNPYRYSILEILHVMEGLVVKRAKYDILNKTDKYVLNADKLNAILNECDENFEFGTDYFDHKFKCYVKEKLI